MSGKSMVLVTLNDNNIAKHPVNYGGVSYGQRVHGDQFYVQADHVPHMAVKVVEEPVEAEPEPVPADQGGEPENPIPADTVIELPAMVTVTLDGLYEWTPEQRDYLAGKGVEDPADVLKLGVEGLVAMKGIGNARAQQILDAALEATNNG